MTTTDRPAITNQALAEAWAEGHRTGWEHCQDGNYGNDYWDDPTPNPYAVAARAETTTATIEDAARAIHDRHCTSDDHGPHCMFWGEDYESAEALHARGLLATARTRPR